MSIMRFGRIGVALALVTSIFAFAVPAHAVNRGGTMIYGRYEDSLLLDPVLNDANSDIWILINLYDTLLRPTKDATGVEPSVATEWKLSDDGLTLSLNIHTDIKFADGSPLTAEDVKWSLDRAKTPDTTWNFTLESVDSVNILAPDKIELKLKHPDPTILLALATFNSAIMPQKLVEAMPGATLDDKAKAFAAKPIGSGPFVLESWEHDVKMVLKPNPHYWRKGEDGKQLPYLDALEFQVIPDDATRILKLKAGDIHGIELVPYAQVTELQADADLRMELWPATRLSYLNINSRPTLKDGSKNVVGDYRVRQALNYALDKDAIIAVSTNGIGKPMTSYIPSSTLHHVGTEPLYPYNPEKAKQLLAEAGYPDGFEMTCLALAGSGDESNNLTAIQAMWAQVGVKVNLEQVDAATRTAKYRADDFQCRVQFWTNDIADPSQETNYVAYFPNVQSLHSGFEDKRLNELFEASQREVNPEKRAEQYKEMQEIYNAKGNMIFLYETPYPVAFRKNAKGFIQTPLGSNIFEGAYIEP